MIDLLDPMLFGNDAAENEDEDSLHYFFVDQDKFKIFDDDNQPLSICRARKGMGKSALIVQTATKKEQDRNNIVIRMTGSDFNFGQITQFTSNLFLQRWEELLNNIINNNICPLEQKSYSLEELKTVNQKVMSKSQDSRCYIWLFVDDIDATFKNTEFERLYLSNFFSACRLLTAKNNFLRIRLSVRQDVWTTIRPSDEALDKCEQYMFDIKWSRSQTRQILARRIRRYLGFSRYLQNTGVRPTSISDYEAEIKTYEVKSDDEILSIIFVSPFPWGHGVSKPHHVIHVFSAGRPRWALQICKEAAHVSTSHNNTQIKFSAINSVLPKYGQFRIADLNREHSHQCTNLEDIIASFFKARAQYSTIEMIDYLERRVQKYYDILIDENLTKATSIEIAHFLYRIGFLEGIDTTNIVKHYHFSEEPFLLKSLSANHDHIRWQIHPAYQAALGVS